MASALPRPLPGDTPDPASIEAWRLVLESAPHGFAVTSGPAHLLVLANDAFLASLDLPEASIGRALAEAGARYRGLVGLLDRARGRTDGARVRARPGAGRGDRSVELQRLAVPLPTRRVTDW